MRATAFALIVALALWSCGGNAGTTPVEPSSQAVAITGPATVIGDSSSRTALALHGGAPVLPLFSFTEPTTAGLARLTFWGTKDPVSGNIGAVTEGEVDVEGTPPSQIHAFFNTAGLPALVRDDASGYSLVITYPTAASPAVTLCDPSMNPVEQASSINGVVTASDGGSCTVALADASPISDADAGAIGSSVPTNLASIGNLAPLLNGAQFVGPLRFVLAALFKFHQHKTNPPAPLEGHIAMAIAALLIGVLLLLIPIIIKIAGGTIFGPTPPPFNAITPAYENPPSSR
jgi:hypothetical protein